MINAHHKYSGKIRDRAISAKKLEERLRINQKNQTLDLVDWLFEKISVPKGSTVLDVGCGNGNQTIPLSKAVGESGRVFAFDISQESIDDLIQKTREKNLDNIQAIVGDMFDVKKIAETEFKQNNFDFIHSSYSLYYVDDHVKAMHELYECLADDGEFAVFTPCNPHGMVEFVKTIHEVPVQIAECFDFGDDILLPFFRDNFRKVTLNYYDNILCISDVEEFMSLYSASTYFDENRVCEIRAAIDTAIKNTGVVKFPKTGFLIQGKGKRDKFRAGVGNA